MFGENNWKEICEEHKKEDPEKARLFKRLASGDLPEGFFQAFNNHIVDLQENTDSVATRKCSQIVLEFLKEQLPELVGGSADLSGSNNTITKLSTAINSDPSGNYIYYGVREFGMNLKRVFVRDLNISLLKHSTNVEHLKFYFLS